MLWYKSWLETRWRFLIGFALLMFSACATVVIYPQVMKLVGMVPTNLSGPLGERIRESAQLARVYKGYVWSKWFRENGTQWSTIFGVLLGTAGILAPSAGRLFTLSLPVSRRQVLGVRALLGLGELFVLAIVPALLIPIVSPVIGERYSVVSTIVHALCLYIAASMFFFFAFLLSTVFDDPWRPPLIALVVAFVASLFEFFLPFPYGFYRVMTAESYFRNGQLPWLGLLAIAAVSAALYFAALRNVERRDY